MLPGTGEGSGASFGKICSMTLIPAVSMAAGSAAVSMAAPSETLQARMQRFSAGLLVGAVVTEIFPILKERLLQPQVGGSSADHNALNLNRISWSDMTAAVLGFSAALVLLYSVKAIDLEGDNSISEAESPGTGRCGSENNVWLQARGDGDEETSMKLQMWLGRLQCHASALSKLAQAPYVDRDAVDEELHGMDFLVDSARRLCRGAEPMDRRSISRLRNVVSDLINDVEKLRTMNIRKVQETENQLRVAKTSLMKVHCIAERATFRRWGPQVPVISEEQLIDKVPVGLVVAVIVDAVIDGMLIGLAGAVSISSGRLMATATTFEMGFLGYSFACSIIKAARPWTAVVILALPPLAMLFAAGTAGLSVNFIGRSPAFSGFVAFAMVALLFLVFQELLVEAHEKEHGGAWHISLWLYAGLLFSINSDMFF